MRMLVITLSILLCASSARAQVTERVSVADGGAQSSSGASVPSPVAQIVSADGRYVLFLSADPSLVPGDTNMTWDVFLRDRLTATTERVNVDSNGVQANAPSGLYGAAISADGRYVVFDSTASNLVPGDTNGWRDIFVRDRWTGTTARVSVDSNGVQGNASSISPSMSLDGQFVVFVSTATNFVQGDTNGFADIFLHDRMSGTTELVSLSTGGSQGNGDSLDPSVSADGLFVAFDSNATNLGPLDSNNAFDVFVRNRQIGLTTRVSRSSTGTQGNSQSYFPSISADGRFVTFISQATNLVPGDTNAKDDIFVNDRLTAITERISVGPGGAQADSHCSMPSLTADGRFVSFHSAATTLVANGPAGISSRIYVHDRSTGLNEIASFATNGTDPNNSGCNNAWISADGRYVAFQSPSTDLVPGDTNGHWDVFIHDRFASGFTSLCDPGLGGVIACPCVNAPATAGRGCDNSSQTGGAALGASGNAYLGIDSLVFTTQFEKPHATSILLGSDTLLAGGSAFGQGVRCVGGAPRRFYVKLAVNGSISAPDLGLGDPSVSARAAQLGALVQPGVPYYFQVYYRDPSVLGGCLRMSTFNSTQTGSVSWWP